MKATLFSLFLFLCLVSQASAQISLVDNAGNALTSPLTVNGDANNVQNVPVTGYIKVKNTGANTLSIKTKFTRVTVAGGHQNNYFCWGGTCYTSTTLDSPNSVSLAGGATTNDTDRCIMYVSGTQQQTAPIYGGTSSFDYTFYESGNPNNSVTIRVNFVITGATSIEDLGVSGLHFAPISPNPTTGKFTIKAEGIEKARQTAIEILTPQGKTITRLPLQNWQNKQHEVILPALSRGMYLYRYAVDGRQSKMGKLIITE